jgi:hypothetical protein
MSADPGSIIEEARSVFSEFGSRTSSGMADLDWHVEVPPVTSERFVCMLVFSRRGSREEVGVATVELDRGRLTMDVVGRGSRILVEATEAELTRARANPRAFREALDGVLERVEAELRRELTSE